MAITTVLASSGCPSVAASHFHSSTGWLVTCSDSHALIAFSTLTSFWSASREETGCLHTRATMQGIEAGIQTFKAERREGALPVECDHAGNGAMRRKRLF